MIGEMKKIRRCNPLNIRQKFKISNGSELIQIYYFVAFDPQSIIIKISTIQRSYVLP